MLGTQGQSRLGSQETFTKDGTHGESRFVSELRPRRRWPDQPLPPHVSARDQFHYVVFKCAVCRAPVQKGSQRELCPRERSRCSLFRSRLSLNPAHGRSIEPLRGTLLLLSRPHSVGFHTALTWAVWARASGYRSLLALEITPTTALGKFST